MMSARLQAIRDAQNKILHQEAEKSDNESTSSKSAVSDGNATDDETSSSSSDSEHAGAGENAKNDDDDDEEEEEEDETEVQEKESTVAADSNASLTFICEALGDFSAEEPTDLSISKGDMLTVISMRDDGWWEVENQDGDKGMVPSTFLKIPEKIRKFLEGAQTSVSSEEKGHLWGKLRSTVKQAHTFEDALTSMGAFPIGFCQPTLAKLVQEDSRYSTEAFLAPKLNDSGLSFKDIKWCNESNNMKPLTARLQRAVRLVAFRQVHPPGSGFEVSSHHVRICLHDGSKVLSNVHTIRAKWDPKVPKIWTFLPKISSSGCCLDEGQFFIRSNSSSATIGVLFQLCVTFKKTGIDEVGEMSCGWVFMRLLDDSGLPVPNRTRVLHIHPGVPFMSQQGSPIASGSKGSALKHFMNRSKQPRLVVTITMLKRKSDQLLYYLPTTLIGPVSSIPLLVLYRKILTDKLLKDRISFDNTELIQSPFLSNFPKLFSQPDLLDVFRKLWTDKCKKLKQSTLKNEEDKKLIFQQLFTETVFLMIHCCTFPEYSLGSVHDEQARKSELAKVVKLIKDHGSLAFALSPEYRFRPLSIKNLSINIIGMYHLSTEGIE